MFQFDDVLITSDPSSGYIATECNAPHFAIFANIFQTFAKKNEYYLKCSSHRLSRSEAGGGFVELRVSQLALDPENNNQVRGVACAQNWYNYAKQHLTAHKSIFGHKIGMLFK